jgi:molecular chaperone GrpE
MSDQARRNETAADEAANGNAAEERRADDAAREGNDGDYEALVRLLKENEELKDRALRAAAEMENLRRRTSREVADARAYAIANFARDMLAVSDNLRRALDALPKEESGAEKSGVLSALVEGVEMTERAMLSALERHGVSRLEPQGEKFDPNFHQAMFEVPDASVPANTVVQVVQAGYRIGDRVLRPAMVGVAKGGPQGSSQESHKAEEPAAAEPGPVNAQAEKDA